MLSSLMAVVLYASATLMVVGVALRVIRYARTPAPLKIPTTPAPITRAGVVVRLLEEVVLFKSLFKATKWTWIFGWLFHAGMLVALLGHVRFFSAGGGGVTAALQSAGKYAGLIMLVGLLGLQVRRLLVDRVRYISSPSDHLMLLLLLAIAGTGVLMRHVAHTDIVALKAFALGLLRFELQPLPGDPLLVTHLLLVAALMAVFPFSKLLHAPGVFFSPTRNQVDNPRERRHLAPWAAKLDGADRPAAGAGETA